MHSRILGRVALDHDRLRPEIERIRSARFSDEYGDFVFGRWQSLVLANPTGDQDDTTFRASDGPARATALGRELPGLFALIRQHFDTGLLRWVRIFRIDGGILVPHRDYTEFADPYVRLNLALVADPEVLHSEERLVYHMRPGEIWHLDAYRVHAACGLNGASRLALCLDFACPGANATELVLPAAAASGPTPDLRARPALALAQRDAIRGLAAIMSHDSFANVTGLLARLHFQYEAEAADLFDWQKEICAATCDQSLIARAERYRAFCIGPRALHERMAH